VASLGTSFCLRVPAEARPKTEIRFDAPSHVSRFLGRGRFSIHFLFSGIGVLPCATFLAYFCDSFPGAGVGSSLSFAV